MRKLILTTIIASLASFTTLAIAEENPYTDSYKEFGEEVTLSHGAFAYDGEPLSIYRYDHDGTIHLYNLTALVLLKPNEKPTVIPLEQEE